MTEYEHFKLALGSVESENQPNSFGDAGRACGRWQMHPEFFHDYYPGPPVPDETWDHWFDRALQGFWLRHRAKVQSVASLAQIFHLGPHAYQRGESCHDYDFKFGRAWTYLASINSKTEVS